MRGRGWTARVWASTSRRRSWRRVADFEVRATSSQQANDDPDVNGIMVYYPIYGGRQDQYLQSVVSSSKDVEGLNHQFLFNLYHK